MKILITGGAGFIGSSLADCLLLQNHEIICFDNFDSFYDKSIKYSNIENAKKNPKFLLVEGDIRNKMILEDCFAANKFDMIIHLAAKAGVRPSIENPEEYCNVNIIGTLNVIEAMKKYEIKKLIFASSSSVYGNNIKLPFSEADNVDNPISPYAASKKACELLCHTYHHLFGFEIFCLRFFTVYGPRQRPDLAIHKFTNNILKGLPIDVFGDGKTSRDYTFIEDIVDGIIKSIEKLKGFEIINLGESQTVSLSQMLSTLEKQLNKKAIINQLPMQQGDVVKTYADISKARTLFNYSPKWEFEKGIAEFIKWKLS